MKVGIVTYQYAYNYGAVLQCLALQRIIESLGHEVSVINYLPPDAHASFLLNGWGLKDGTYREKVRHKVLLLRCFRAGGRMKRRFEEFRESRLNRTVACSSAETIHEIAGQYDALVAGSDQIWHFSRPAMYFLDWGLPYRGKRIGYAACCGSVNQPTGRRSEVSKWLANFQSIGVRDDFSKEIIDELTLGDVPVVADPTVLTSLSDIHTPVPNMPDRYILTYTLGQEITGGNRMLLDALRTEVGKMPVVGVIPSAHKPHMAPWADTCIWDCGPTQWLHLIANASFLLTDSFHGALFALRSGTPFLAYYRESARAPRLLDLARRYSLSAHIASDVEEAMGNRCWETSDYGQSLGLMASHAAYSTEYLRCALAG